MGKLNTYDLKGTLEATFQLIGIIPGQGTSFETARLSPAALQTYVEQYAGVDGTDGRQVELRANTTHIQWRYVGDAAWINLIAREELRGLPGTNGTDGTNGTNGDPGVPVELRKSASAIQWRYQNSPDWLDLVLLTELQGTNGTNGNTVLSVNGAPSAGLGREGDFANDVNNSVMYGPKSSSGWGAGVSYKGLKGDTGTGLRNRGNWVSGTTYKPGDYTFSTGSATSSSMWILSGDADYTSTTLPKDDTSHWVEFVAPAGADGVNGKSVELQKTSTAIQWRQEGDSIWADLVLLDDIRGAAGTNGKTMHSVTTAPATALGVDGDFANWATNQIMYGPKANGAWPAGVSYKGTDGTNGTNGTDGSKWHFGSTVPDGATGANGDFYLRANGDVYGPKAAGAWGSVVASMKGTAGQGVPTGGTTGQVLTKNSAADYDTTWSTPSAGGGTSLPAGGTADQALVKNSAADGDVKWAGPFVATGAVNQNIGGNKTFTGNTTTQGKLTAADIKTTGSFSLGSLYKHPIATSGGTVTLVAGVNSQTIPMAAPLAALTVTLPQWPESGFQLTVAFEKAVTALTITPQIGGGGTTSVVVGAPSGVPAGSITLRYFDTDNAWYVTSIGTGVSVGALHVQDQRPNGTAGGNILSGSWRARTINTIVVNDFGASLATNEITLPAGKYVLSALSCYRLANGTFRMRLQNTTTNTTIVLGVNGQTATDTTNIGVLRGSFTLASSTKIQLQEYTSAGNGANTSGTPGVDGLVEIYTDLLIEKIA